MTWLLASLNWNLKMRVLDLFCGAGGASCGLHYAGFDVVGVDIAPQPNYPFEFVQADAMTYPLDGFDFIWASPPCQVHSNAWKIRGNDHPDLIPDIRARLRGGNAHYCIENVPGAPLLNPVLLCGSMFGLKVYRHRIFEASFDIPFRLCNHDRAQVKMGRKVKEGDIIQVVGHFTNVPYGRRAMGIDWMNQRELAQAIPPAFSEFIAQALNATEKAFAA